MKEVDVVVIEVFNHVIFHESCPLVRDDALRNTKAGNDVLEDKVADRVCQGVLEWFHLNLLGEKVSGNYDKLMLLRGVQVDDTYEIHYPSARRPWFYNRL